MNKLKLLPLTSTTFAGICESCDSIWKEVEWSSQCAKRTNHGPKGVGEKERESSQKLLNCKELVQHWQIFHPGV